MFSRLLALSLLLAAGLGLRPATTLAHSTGTADRLLRLAAQRAAHQRPQAVARWLRSQPSVAGVKLGSDSKTLTITLHSGRTVAVLPPLPHLVGVLPATG